MIIFLLLNEVKPPLNIYEGGGKHFPFFQTNNLNNLNIMLEVLSRGPPYSKFIQCIGQTARPKQTNKQVSATTDFQEN